MRVAAAAFQPSIVQSLPISIIKNGIVQHSTLFTAKRLIKRINKQKNSQK